MFCSHCGKELLDEAVVCPSCGTPTENLEVIVEKEEKTPSTYTAAKIFMIISCIASITSYFIPLIWCIPMTIHLFNCAKKGEAPGTGFSVCTLLFVNMIAGIILLCDKNRR